ncbi:MAG: hypothetical protein JEZ04_20195 [Spirochaetales bacterium]|nr:hypothetical protein [Spirochaetales bacterium]
MHVENTGFNSIKASNSMKRSSAVINAEVIKTILFLGIRSELPASENKRKVDIFI